MEVDSNTKTLPVNPEAAASEKENLPIVLSDNQRNLDDSSKKENPPIVLSDNQENPNDFNEKVNQYIALPDNQENQVDSSEMVSQSIVLPDYQGNLNDCSEMEDQSIALSENQGNPDDSSEMENQSIALSDNEGDPDDFSEMENQSIALSDNQGNPDDWGFNETVINFETVTLKPEAVVNEDNQHPVLSEQQENLDHCEKPYQAVKRKRGRPKTKNIKIKQEKTQPIRESQRKRKAPEVMTYSSMGRYKHVWSEEDKIQLLRGLEEFGHTDQKKLKKYLPHKRDCEILAQIRMWQEFADSEMQKRLLIEKRRMDCAAVNCINKLDDWFKYFKHNLDETSPRLFALRNVFLLISEYASFPSLEDCGGIDFRAMYRFIHCALNGIPFNGVNIHTAQILNQSISDMFSGIRDQNLVAEMQDVMGNTTVHRAKPDCRTYSRPEKRYSKSRSPNAIWTFPDINPLNISESSLVKRFNGEPYSDVFNDDECMTC